METFLFVLAMVAVGLGVGVVSAALGIGGGTLIVPVLLAVYGDAMDMNTAKGTSLLVIVFIALFNAWRMNRGDMRNPPGLIVSLASGSIIGGFLGGYATSLLSDSAVTWGFIAFLTFAVVRTFLLKARHVEESEVQQRIFAAAGIGLIVGIVSGATGTGGGAVLVPLTLWAGIVSNHRVVALSNAVMVGTAAAGVLAHALAKPTGDVAGTVGMLTLLPVPIIVAGAILGSPAGRWLNQRLSLPRRRVVMGILLAIIILRLLQRVVG